MATDADLKDRAGRLVERGKGAKAWWERSTWGRGAKRFSTRNGNVLAGGIAYFSLTSIAAGVVIAATLASLFIANNRTLRDAIVLYLGEVVPGLIETEDTPGLIQPGLIVTTGATITAGLVGLVSLLVLLNAASRYVAGVRTSLRTMLGAEVASPVVGKLRDLVALLLLLVIAIVGLAIQVVASGAVEWVADLFGTSVPSWVVRVIAVLAGLIADMLFAALALILLGGARWSIRLMWVVLVSAIAIGLLRGFISLFVSGVTDNVVLAPFAAIFTLMIFVYYVNRVLLLCGAWLGVQREPADGTGDTGDDAVVTVEGPRRRTPVTTRRATVRQRARSRPW